MRLDRCANGGYVRSTNGSIGRCDCNFCTTCGSSTRTYQAEFSGITACVGCIVDGSNSFRVNTAFNGSICLENVFNCIWRGAAQGGSWTEYAGATCSGAGTTYDWVTSSLSRSLILGVQTARLSIGLLRGLGMAGPVSSIFSADVVPGGGVCIPLTGYNNVNICGGAGVGGSGGSATLAEGCDI